tara:strand:- start:12 stop:176 length:165 start_codon:yes stop_codon:yes gene_type:complete
MPKKDMCSLLLVGSGRRRLNRRSGNARAKQRAKRLVLIVKKKMKEEKGDTKEEK